MYLHMNLLEFMRYSCVHGVNFIVFLFILHPRKIRKQSGRCYACMCAVCHSVSPAFSMSKKSYRTRCPSKLCVRHCRSRSEMNRDINGTRPLSSKVGKESSLIHKPEPSSLLIVAAQSQAIITRHLHFWLAICRSPYHRIKNRVSFSLALHLTPFTCLYM